MFASMMPQAQNTDGVSFPAPIGGVNAVDPLSTMELTDAIYSYNFIPSQYGLKVRRGYQAHVTGLDEQVRTFVPFIDEAGSGNVLFALTVDGIYDITASTDTPSVDTAFATDSGLAGWASWTNFTTIAGQNIALCDEENGYFIFDGSAWAALVEGTDPGEIEGVDPIELVFVTSWKGRLVFAQKDTAIMWYLPVGQITGEVLSFDFGNKFKHGGHLIGLFNWTIDGGEGVDDYLVALSSGGDVVVYKGTDPSTADGFALHGQWYVGTFPAGRRVASTIGGDLLLITGNGVIPLSQLVAGANVASKSSYTTQRISPLVNSKLRSTLEDRGWEVTLLPQEDLLMITTPKEMGYPYFQFVQSLTSQGWFFYRGFPCTTGVTFDNKFFLGDEDGNVHIHQGSFDNVALDGSTFNFVEFSLLTAFQNFGAPTRFKRVQFLRPMFLSSGAPAVEIKAVYDYDLQEILPPSTTPLASDNAWGSAVWDLAVWGGGSSKLEIIRGGSGMGRKVAAALRGTCNGDMTLVEIECLMDIGGHL